SGFAQTIAKRDEERRRIGSGGCAAEVAHDRQRFRLGACGERPAEKPAGQQRDKAAPLHSMTSSARAMMACGISTPIARATLRLITSSNFVGCRAGSRPEMRP